MVRGDISALRCILEGPEHSVFIQMQYEEKQLNTSGSLCLLRPLSCLLLRVSLLIESNSESNS